MKELSSQRLTVQVKNINSENILSRIEIEEVMAYVNGEMLNETPIQSSTASIGDTPNVEVEDHEINIGMFPLFFFHNTLGCMVYTISHFS